MQNADPNRRREKRERWENMDEEERNKLRQRGGKKNSWAPEGD